MLEHDADNNFRRVLVGGKDKQSRQSFPAGLTR